MLNTETPEFDINGRLVVFLIYNLTRKQMTFLIIIMSVVLIVSVSVFAFQKNESEEDVRLLKRYLSTNRERSNTAA